MANSLIKEEKENLQKIQSGLQKDIESIFNNTFYTPLSTIFKKKKRKEAEGKLLHLMQALHSGRIIYSFKKQGFFIRDFTLKAVEELKSLPIMYLGNEKLYHIEYSRLPTNLQSLTASLHNEDIAKAKKTVELLTLGLTMLTGINTKNIVEKHFEKLDKLTFDKFPEVAEKSKLVTDTVEKVNGDFTAYINETDKSIKGFADKEITELRNKVVDMIERGEDLSKLESKLKSNKDLSQSRAKLISRQEISNATLEYDIKRYADLGITKFKWMNPNPNEDNARPHHKLYGEMSMKGVLFDATNPPQDPKTGIAEMPSEAFNCDCYPIFVKETNI